jgi:hypothetical protein
MLNCVHVKLHRSIASALRAATNVPQQQPPARFGMFPAVSNRTADSSGNTTFFGMPAAAATDNTAADTAQQQQQQQEEEVGEEQQQQGNQEPRQQPNLDGSQHQQEQGQSHQAALAMVSCFQSTSSSGKCSFDLWCCVCSIPQHCFIR